MLISKKTCNVLITFLPPQIAYTHTRQFGGAGMDYMAYAIAIEELSRGCASTGVGGDWVDGFYLFGVSVSVYIFATLHI